MYAESRAIATATVPCRRQEIVDLLGVDPERVLSVSAKEGIGSPALLEEIIRRVPALLGDARAPLRALIFDSYYDRFPIESGAGALLSEVRATGSKVRVCWLQGWFR